MQTRKRVTVSLPKELVARAERDVEAGESPSISAWIAAAMAIRAQRGTLQGVLDEIFAQTGGPPTEEERAWVRSILDR